MEDTTRRFWLDGACFFAFLFFFVVGNNGKCVSALSDSDGPLCYADLPTAPFEMSGWDIASVCVCVVCGAVGRRGDSASSFNHKRLATSLTEHHDSTH